MQYKTNYLPTISFTSLLQTSADLQKFTTKLSQLEQLSNFIANYLEPTLASQCKVANLRDGSLILTTTSPAWNHKLRFVSLELLSALRKNPLWSGLKSIEVRVDYLPAMEHDNITDLKKSLCMSPQNAKLIQELAHSISCPTLANALKKLASNSR